MRRTGLRRFIRRPTGSGFRAPQAGLRTGESGQGLAEYAIILTLVAMVCVAALTLLGQTLPPFYQQVAGAL